MAWPYAHTVTITEDGFVYAGTSYPSLTKIAKKITGAHWSGPRFFGLQADISVKPFKFQTETLPDISCRDDTKPGSVPSKPGLMPGRESAKASTQKQNTNDQTSRSA